jgi:2-isopropylmalate synthase
LFFVFLTLFILLLQALASTRVVIVPKPDGPNDSYKLDAQSGQLKERKFTGSGSDTDIITSSARAYVTALNKLLQWQMRRMEVNGNANGDMGGIGDAVPVAGEAPSVVMN